MGRSKVSSRRENLDGTPYIPVYEETSEQRKRADREFIRRTIERQRMLGVKIVKWDGGTT